MPVKDTKPRWRNKALVSLQELVADMIVELDLQVILQKAVKRTAELVEADIVTIHIYDPLTVRVRAAAGYGLWDEETFQQHEPGRGKVALLVVNKGEPVIAEDVSTSELAGPFTAREGVQSAAGFPLKVGDKVIGVLFVNYREPHKFEPEEIETLVSFGNLAAVAIENANLIEQERRRADAMNLLQQVSARISAPLDVEETLALIIKSAMRLTGTDSGVIHLVDEARETVIQSHEVPEGFGHLPPRFSQKTGMTWTAITTGQTIAVSDITRDERVNPAMAEKGVKAIIGTPLKVEDKIIGVLFLNDSEPHEFTEYEKELLSTLASQAAITIQNARLFETRLRLNAQLASLHQVVQEQSLDKVLDRILKGISAILGEGTSPTINLYDEETDRFGQCHAYGPLKAKLMVPPRSTGGTGRYVLKTGEPLYLDDVHNPPPGCPTVRPESIAMGIKSFAALPLKRQEQVVGVLFVNIQKPLLFSEEIRRVLELFASQAAIAIENAALFEQERQRADAMNLLQQVSAKISAALDEKETVALIIEGAMRLTGTESGVIHLVDEAKQAVIQSYEVPEGFGHLSPRFSQEKGMTWTAVSTGQTIAVSDITKDERVNPAMAEKGVRAIIGTPLKVEEETIGVLFLNDSEPHEFTEYEKELLSTLANHAAIAIQNARLFGDAERRIRDLGIVNKVVETISTKLNTEDLLNTIVCQIADQLNCTHCTLFFPKEEKGELLLVPHVTHGVRSEIMTRRFKLDEGLAGWVFQKGESVVLPDVRQDDRFSPAREVRDRPRSMLVAPVEVGDQTIGVISADQDEYGWFSESDRRLLDALARHAGIAIEKGRLYQDLGRRITQLEVLRGIYEKIIAVGIKGIDRILDLLYEEASRVMDLSNAQVQIAFYDEAKDEVSFPLAVEQDEGKIIDVVRWSEREARYRKADEDEVVEHFLPRARRDPPGLNEYVIRTKEPLLIVEDFEQKAKAKGIQVWPTFGRLDRPTHSWLGVPMMVGGRVVGVISIQSLEQERAFDEEQQELLSTVASQAAVAIENATLYAEMEKRVEERTRAWREAQEKAAAAERLSLMSEVAAEFAHKMNNLAGTMPIRVDYLRDKFQEYDLVDPLAVEMLEGIYNDAVGLLEGARVIRQATRSEARTEVDVNELVEIAVARVRSVRPEMANIVVERRLEPNLPNLELPRNRLADTLENLITNAVDAMSKGGTLTVATSLTVRDQEAYLAIAVTDTGHGIARANLTKIFDLFFSTKPGGLGFGLWRDKNFAKELGGEIEVESEERRGSTFTLLIPSEIV